VKTVKVTFIDINQSWLIHIRKGIAGVVEYESGEVDSLQKL